MLVKRLLKRVPFADRAYKRYTALANERAKKRVYGKLGNVANSRGTQIAHALEMFEHQLPQSEQDWIDRIEIERMLMLGRNHSLVDGSLGEAGPYDITRTVRQACLASKRPKQALLLFLLTRYTKPSVVIELGTNVGISSAYISAALELNANNGTIMTLDVSPYRQRLARETHRNLALRNISYVNGFFSDTLQPALMELGSVDLAFIDGHHQFQPTLDYFEEILKFSTPETIFIFDDIRWSDGMKEAWSQIQADDRLGLIVDLSSIGVCVHRQQDIPHRFVFEPISIF